MNKYLDCSNATGYATTKKVLIDLATVFEENLLKEHNFFVKIRSQSYFDQELSSKISRQEIKQHLHQLIGFLPIFCAKEALNEVIILADLVQNSSSSEFRFPVSRLKEILEGLQSELKVWRGMLS